jgi:hypothetical protein
MFTKNLIETRCNIDLQTVRGFTPFYVPVHNGQVVVTEQLIEQEKHGDTQIYIVFQRCVYIVSVTKKVIEVRHRSTDLTICSRSLVESPFLLKKVL